MSRFFLAFFLASLATVSQAVESTFDIDNEGWQTCSVNFGTPAPPSVGEFLPAGWTGGDGVPAGSLLTADVASWCFLAAPAKFLGDRSASLGSALSFDTYAPSNDGVPYPAVILRSGTKLLFNLSAPPASTWTHRSVSLVGSAWSLSELPGGVAVSDATLQGFLRNLDGLYIEADWFNGAGLDTTGLDNVRLGTVPEPASMAVLALGLGAIVRRRPRTP